MSSEAVDDSSVELEKEEDEVEEEEDEEEEEIKPVKSIAKKLSKKELAALAAQPKAKKARNVAVVEEYAIEQEAPKLSTREKRLQLKLDAVRSTRSIISHDDIRLSLCSKRYRRRKLWKKRRPLLINYEN